MSEEPPYVKVSLDTIYREVKSQGDRLDELATAVSSMVSINKRLDQHHERLNDHGSRLGTLETANAIAAATARPRSPWYAVVGAVVGILTGVSVLIALIAVASKLGALIG